MMMMMMVVVVKDRVSLDLFTMCMWLYGCLWGGILRQLWWIFVFRV